MKPSREELNELIAELTGTDTNTSKNTDTNAFENINIDNLTKEQLFDKENFQAILSISDPSKRMKIILQFEERAKKLRVKKPFDEVLDKYQKQYSKNEKNQKESKVNLTHNEIADKLLKTEKICRYENKLYIYDDNKYTDKIEVFENKIIKIKPDSTFNFRMEVYKYLNVNSNVIEKELNRENGFINFKNKIYNFKNKKEFDHTPNIFTINQINANYKPDAEKVQVVDEVLDRLCLNKQGEVNKKRRQTILEMIGYSMTTSTKLQKAFVLYGETARNGKSTLISIISKLIGSDNVSTIPFDKLNKNNFAGAGIKGKLLNVGTEMTNEFVEDISNFKMLVTGDELEIEEKYKARQKISPYAKLIFNANELPTVADKTNGFYRRLQIIPLEHSFTENDALGFKIEKLETEKARDYLAKISLEAFEKMGEKFSNWVESEKEIEKYKNESNSVLEYVNDADHMQEFIERMSVRKASEVYEDYTKYCKVNQRRPIGRNKFYREIEQNSIITDVRKDNHQKVYTFDKIKNCINKMRKFEVT